MSLPWQDLDLVVDCGDGGPCNTVRASKTFKSLVRRLGYPRLRFHDTRHGYATVMLAAGVDLKVISTQMGHSTYAITADIYADVVPALQAGAAARMDAILGPQPV